MQLCLHPLAQLCEMSLHRCMQEESALFLCCVVSHGMATSHFSKSAGGELLYPIFTEGNSIPGWT